jgi:type I restriction enzyme S subunit
MSFPRYPAYKDSGVEWLGEVPEHWSVERFKLSVESCVNGVWGEEPGNGENDVTCIRVADFDRLKLVAAEPNEPTIRSVSARDIEQRSLCNEDLLIEKSGGGEKQPVGAVVLYTGSTPSVCSNFVALMRLAQSMNPSFWRYAHHAAYSLKVNTKSIKQTSGIQNLDQQQYLDEKAPFPPGEEQITIATFLDRETAKIDALIAEQQRLIELLQEKRQAVISHAVTKGLNPDAPMKDSGVEWLGEVPEHWEVRKLSQLCDGIGSGTTPKSDVPEFYEEEGLPWIVTGDLKDCLLETCSNHITVKAMAEHSALKLYDIGSVVVAMYGATIGKAAILGMRATVNQACCVLPPGDQVLGGFLLLFVLAARVHLISLATGGGQPNINQEVVRSLRIPLPPVADQQEIIQRVGASLETLDSVASFAALQVEILQERRSALISAAVTGQIDVRGLVPEAEAA